MSTWPPSQEFLLYWNIKAIPEVFVEYRRKNYKIPRYTKNQQKIFYFLVVSHLVKHLFCIQKIHQEKVTSRCICLPTVSHDCRGSIKLKSKRYYIGLLIQLIFFFFFDIHSKCRINPYAYKCND